MRSKSSGPSRQHPGPSSSPYWPIKGPFFPLLLAPLPFAGLHHWAGNGREFTEVARLFAIDFALLAPDITGFRDAPAPAAGYSAAADDLAHSMGG